MHCDIHEDVLMQHSVRMQFVGLILSSEASAEVLTPQPDPTPLTPSPPPTPVVLALLPQVIDNRYAGEVTQIAEKATLFDCP